MALVFWFSVATVAYVYVGYPLLLRLWAWLRPKPVIHCGSRIAECGFGSDPQSAFRDPPYGVSIVIAARNEGARLASRLDNLLSLDYPAARRQIVVVSDGSADDTLDVLARYRRFVDVVAVP